MIDSADHGRVVEFVALVLHHVHELVLRQAIIDLVARLLRVVQDLGRLPKLLRCLALRTRRIVMFPTLASIWLACIQLSQV